MTHVARLCVALGPDALDKVQQQLARHGLDGGRQRLVVHVLREEVHSEGQVVQGQVRPHVVNQVRQCAVGQRSARQHEGTVEL